MLSNQIFTRLWVTMRDDIHFEVTKAFQGCWQLESDDGTPVACILGLADTPDCWVSQKASPNPDDTAITWTNWILNTASLEALKVVLVNLLFDYDIQFRCTLPSGEKWEHFVHPGGSLSVPIYLSKVRAFNMEALIPVQARESLNRLRWKFNKSGIVCRPRFVNAPFPSHAMLVGSGGPIHDDFDSLGGSQGGAAFELDDQLKEETNDTSAMLEVRIQMDAQAKKDEDVLSSEKCAEEGAQKMVACMNKMCL